MFHAHKSSNAPQPINIKNIPDMTTFVAGYIKSKIVEKPKPKLKTPKKQDILVDKNKEFLSIYLLSFLMGLYSHFFKNPVIIFIYLILIFAFNKDILTQIIFIFMGGLMSVFINSRFKLKLSN